MSGEISPRRRVADLLHGNRPLIAAELLLAIALVLAQLVGSLNAAVLLLLPLGWLSLWLRRSGWRSLGLARPASWPRTLTLGLVLGFFYQALSILAVSPLLEALTGEAVDLSQFAYLRGDFPATLVAIAGGWIVGGIFEEMVFRGYLLHRLADLTGRRPAGWLAALATTAFLFGIGHAYQGISGMIETALFGLAMGVIYLRSGQNLWLAIISHGVVNTAAFVLIYAGLYG